MSAWQTKPSSWTGSSSGEVWIFQSSSHRGLLLHICLFTKILSLEWKKSNMDKRIFFCDTALASTSTHTNGELPSVADTKSNHKAVFNELGGRTGARNDPGGYLGTGFRGPTLGFLDQYRWRLSPNFHHRRFGSTFSSFGCHFWSCSLLGDILWGAIHLWQGKYVEFKGNQLSFERHHHLYMQKSDSIHY